MRYTVIAALMCVPFVAGCVTAQPPTDTGDSSAVSSPTSPSGPSTPTTPTTPASDGATPLAYNQDMKALFQSDCVSCHGSGRADGNYRMTTYSQVMAAVRAGSASSALVAVTQQNGGACTDTGAAATATRQSKAASVRSWVVVYNAQENR